MSRALCVTSMQNRDTQTPDYCLLPVQQNNRTAHLTDARYHHLTHTGHILSAMLYTKVHRLSPEPGLYPLWVLELGIK